MRTHEQTPDGHLYKCTKCNLSFYDRIGLELHSCKRANHRLRTSKPRKPKPKSHKEALEEKGFQCSQCFIFFHTITAQIDHEIMEHTDLKKHFIINKDQKLFQCGVCEEKFTRQGQLVQHVVTLHSKLEPYTCNHCNASFKGKIELNNHLRSQHQIIHRFQKSKRIFQCKNCRFKSFESADELENHMKTCQKKFECKTCGKKFPVAIKLRQHEMIHTGEKPFPCKECPKRFRNKQDLQKHMRTHSGERPFPCRTCKRSFSCQSSRRKHEKQHEDGPEQNRDFACSVCGDTFEALKSLRNHLARTHKQKPEEYLTKEEILEKKQKRNKSKKENRKKNVAKNPEKYIEYNNKRKARDREYKRNVRAKQKRKKSEDFGDSEETSEDESLLETILEQDEAFDEDQ